MKKCGNSWILRTEKPQSKIIYISVYTSGMTLLANKVARQLSEFEDPFDACSELANDIANENKMGWSNVLVQYYNHYSDTTPCIPLKVPKKPLNESRVWFDSLSKKEQEMYAGIEYNVTPDDLNDGMIETIYLREGKPSPRVSDRQIAMTWFNNKASLEKTRLCDNYTEIVGKVRRYETLTGSEIEKIWRLETQANFNASNRDEDRSASYGFGTGGKSTKKLYTQEEVDRLLDRQAADTANQVIKSHVNKVFKDYPIESDVFNLSNKTKFTVAELKQFSEEYARRVVKRGQEWNLEGFWSLCKEMFYDKFKTKSYIKKREFDENLFKSYIDKFSEEDKQKAFKMFKPQISDMLYTFADIVDDSYRPYTRDNIKAYQAIPDFKKQNGIE